MFGWILKRRPSDPKELGMWGQARAEKALRAEGLRTLARNVACRDGELDLIMVERDRTVVFVEVKTRAGEDFQPAETAITAAKKSRLVKAARFWMAGRRVVDRPLRFDVVTVVVRPKGRPEIRHYKRAFVP